MPKGLRTLGFNIVSAVGLSALPILGVYDWTQHVSPFYAMLIINTINFGLRLITTTPVMKAK